MERDIADLIVYEADGKTERLRFDFPRQDHGDFLCLSDYARPGDGRATDVVAFFAVTMGDEVSRRAKEYFEAGPVHRLPVPARPRGRVGGGAGRTVPQAAAEEWGIAGDDSPVIQKLFKKHYRGCRYAFGYPACPNLEDQAKLFDLLDPSGSDHAERAVPARTGAVHDGPGGPPPAGEVLQRDPHGRLRRRLTRTA